MVDAPHGTAAILATLKPGARVLDYGYGFGRTLSELLEAGFDAYGVEISQDELDRCHDPRVRERMRLVDEPFPDEHFDLVISYMVLEHVADLPAFVRDVARLTKRGGVGLHEWPGKWRPVEPHYRMPVVHWLPKNGVRRAAITTLAYAGMYPPDMTPGRSRSDVAEETFRYSTEETFYRPARKVAAAFAGAGFDTRWLPHPRWAGPLVRTLRTVTLQTVHR